MLQVDHVYEFLYQELFKDFEFWFHPGGVVKPNDANITDICIFTHGLNTTKKIFFYDQEPLIQLISDRYFEIFNFPNQFSVADVLELSESNSMPFGYLKLPDEVIELLAEQSDVFYKKMILVSSEISPLINFYKNKYSAYHLYYFYHGFAALDWFRGHYSLNYSKNVTKSYEYDYISYNRIINNDRSYRIYWVSKLKELGMLHKGLVSFNVTDNLFEDWRDEVADPNTKLSAHACSHAEQYLTEINKLVIDQEELPGSASANIPRTIPGYWPNNDQPKVDALWHIVTETVFYYDKLHLTEKIFKPIVSKQPFMLLAAPGNLAYLRSYGFKTFEGIIDESYDNIVDNDDRIDAVAKQLQWYCNLSPEEKSRVIERLAPIVEYNFQHFYGEFKHIITQELLDNTKSLFKDIGYDDSTVAYENIYRVLTT